MSVNYHSNTELRILSQTANGYIGQCPCCDRFNFSFNNLLFLFNLESLHGFGRILNEDEYVTAVNPPLPNGKRYSIPSPLPNFLLTFRIDELDEIRTLFQETLLVLQINNILKS
jgi:hypothetical protein